MEKSDLFNEVKGVSFKVSKGLRETMTEDLGSDNYIEANLLRGSFNLKYSNLYRKVIILDKVQAKHKVYACYLEEDVLEKDKFKEANPKYVKGKPCVYAGMTGKLIKDRFDEHISRKNKNYRKGSRMMKKFGSKNFSKALAIELLNHPNILRENLTFGEALQNEKLYGEWLCFNGYGISWN